MQAYGEYILMRVTANGFIDVPIVAACSLESARVHYRRLRDKVRRRVSHVAVYGVKAGRLHAIEGVL